MAFQNLLEGDCGGQNPLMKLGSHFSQDQAFRQERVHNLPTQFSDAECLVNEFLEDRFGQNLQTFRMDSLAEELRDIDRFTRNPLPQAPNVAQLAPRETDALWSEEFLRAEKQGAGTIQPLGPLLFNHPTPNLEGDVSLSASGWSQEFLRSPKEDGFLDFDRAGDTTIEDNEEVCPTNEQFERAITNPRVAAAQAQMAQVWNAEASVPDSEWIQSFLHNRQDELGLVDLRSGEAESKFQKFWQKADSPEEKILSGDVFSAESLEGYGNDDAFETGDTKQFWESMKNMWQTLSMPEGASGEDWQQEFSAFVDPYKVYTFEEENPMKEVENPMEEGLRKLEAQDVPSAVLCFEAAAQADPENALAWQYLGTTQAKNEQDPFAIAAFKKCISLEPDNLTALLGLAISYTNENYQNQAVQMLREWLLQNPKYKDLPAPDNKQFYASILDSEFHRQVKDYFITAANRTPVGEIDAGVQCALGVLFNLSYEYDKAVDCFKAALSVVPNDYEMWNRLGATLANGNRSEEAVDAYYNALQLSPGYIRARYNLGITCINLGANREAVEHLLSALNQQAKSSTSRGEKGSMSDSIWSTLRLVVSQLGNGDILPAIDRRDLETLNREYSVK